MMQREKHTMISLPFSGIQQIKCTKPKTSGILDMRVTLLHNRHILASVSFELLWWGWLQVMVAVTQHLEANRRANVY